MSPRKKSAARSSGSRGGPFLLRLLLIVIVLALLAAFLPAPWAINIGGHFNALGQWDGYGPVQASNGGSYILFTHLHGGITNGDAAACTIHGCESLTGSAQLCTSGGQRYTFDLSGAVHGWFSTNGAPTDIKLTGGTPKALPHGWVVTFHGTWRGPVLPIADTGKSFTKVFTPAGAIRTAAAPAGAGTAHGELRYGSAAAFAQACNKLATGAH
jgi:hypothetical protein